MINSRFQSLDKLVSRCCLQVQSANEVMSDPLKCNGISHASWRLSELDWVLAHAYSSKSVPQPYDGFADRGYRSLVQRFESTKSCNPSRDTYS